MEKRLFSTPLVASWDALLSPPFSSKNVSFDAAVPWENMHKKHNILCVDF
jgi:hypothetical protein